MAGTVSCLGVTVVFSRSSGFHDFFEWTNGPILFNLAVDLYASNVDAFELFERHETPFRALPVIVQTSESEEEIVFGAILSYPPITAADEEVQMNEFVVERYFVGLIKFR